MAATAKECHALINHFIKGYKDKYDIEPVLNRHAARWGMSDLLEQMSSKSAKELIDYYFTTASAKRHSLDWFMYNYDKLITARLEAQEDAERRARLLVESEERARKWRERGKQRTASN